MQVYCPGGRSLDSNDIKQSILNRQLSTKQFNYGGSWIRNNRYLNDADIDQLGVVKDIALLDGIKVRIEEPYVSFYADSEQDLKNLLEMFEPRSRERLKTICVPKDQRHIELLKENKILKTSRRINYNFKVTLKDGRLNIDRKLNILNYLNSLGDIVYLPPASIRMLENTYTGFWGVYYYTNDISINTFVSLIQPGIVANVHEIVIVE